MSAETVKPSRERLKKLISRIVGLIPVAAIALGIGISSCQEKGSAEMSLEIPFGQPISINYQGGLKISLPSEGSRQTVINFGNYKEINIEGKAISDGEKVTVEGDKQSCSLTKKADNKQVEIVCDKPNSEQKEKPEEKPDVRDNKDSNILPENAPPPPSTRQNPNNPYTDNDNNQNLKPETSIVTPTPQTNSKPSTNQKGKNCVVIGQEASNAFRAWIKLEKPEEIIYIRKIGKKREVIVIKDRDNNGQPDLQQAKRVRRGDEFCIR